MLLFIILLNAFGQEKGKEDIKYLKGGGKITIIAYGIILYLKSPKELSEKWSQQKYHGGKLLYRNQ